MGIGGSKLEAVLASLQALELLDVAAQRIERPVSRILDRKFVGATSHWRFYSGSLLQARNWEVLCS